MQYQSNSNYGYGWDNDTDHFPSKSDYTSAKNFKFGQKSIRLGFIRKVYSILSAQLILTFGFVALFNFHDGLKMAVFRNPTLLNVALFLPVGIMLLLSFSESARRQSPLNIILLTVFTLCKGVALGILTTLYEVEEVLTAIGITALIVISLTMFAFQSKYDMTMQTGVLFSMISSLLIMSIVGIFYKGEFFHFMLACGGAVVFSVYIIYDTQLMMGGDHKYSISPEEYIFGALNIYMDIINLFLQLLKILRYLNEQQQNQQRRNKRN